MLVKPPYIRPGIKPASEWPKLAPAASYDPGKKIVSVSNGYPVKEVLRADGFRWDAQSKTWQRSMTLAEFKEETSLLTSIGVSLDAATRQLVAVEKPVQPKPEPKPAPEAKTEGWSAISPASIEGLKKARERLIAMVETELPMRRGMKITDPADREALRSIALLLRQVIAEA